MTLKEYVDAFRKLWWVVALAATVGLVLGVGLVLASPATYQARVDILLPTSGLGAQQSVASIMTSAIDLAESQRMASAISQARRDRALPAGSPDAIANSIVADVQGASTVLRIAVSGTTPDDVTNTTTVLPSVFNQLLTESGLVTGPDKTGPVNVLVLQSGTQVDSPARAEAVKNGAMGATIGLVIGSLVVITRYAVQRTPTPREAEN